MFLLAVGGTFALIFRSELAASGLDFLTLELDVFNQNGPQIYNTLMSLHGMIMIVSILLGISGIMNYVVPLLVGAHDMAFPRMNAFAYWVAVPASVLLLLALILGGFDTAGLVILRFPRAPRLACKCSFWACSQPVGRPSSAR
ncbi:MAG: cbb3-type cytochrome c oxidase subunit I [Anaerolineae bacterium]|nr:cbb3-type cytochrome c oxidase subunit I [Anaerolineae bacterium]